MTSIVPTNFASPLTGNETIRAFGVSPNGMPCGQDFYLTTSQIAALASSFSNDAPTAVTAVIGTTLTASALLSGLINRTGPTAIYTDTTDTAANIATLSAVGDSFYIDIKNATAFIQTLTGGTGVTFSSSNIIPANSIAQYLVQVVSATSVVFNHVFTTAIADKTLQIVTALTTVGAGTITGIGIAGTITTRGGAQSGAAFTDTTDTAANIIAAQPNAHIGDSWVYIYQNTTNGTATLTGGPGVTVSGNTVVPVGTYAMYLVTYTAAATITMAGVGGGPNSPLPVAQFTTAADATTFAAGALTGSAWTNHTNTANTPGTVSTRTAALMIADIPNSFVGMTYMLRIRHNGTGTLTVGAGVSVTITGTATIATTTYRDYMVSITSGTTVTLQDMGSGAA